MFLNVFPVFYNHIVRLNKIVSENRVAVIAGQTALPLIAILRLEQVLQFDTRAWTLHPDDFYEQPSAWRSHNKDFSLKEFCQSFQ